MQPTIVYKCPGPHKAGRGKTYDWRGVKTQIEMGKLLGNGWFETLEEAMNPPKKKDSTKDYKVGLDEEGKLKSKPKTIKNLDGEEIEEGQLGDLPKMGRGRPKKKKEIFGDEG